jgi:hypothetical protein
VAVDEDAPPTVIDLRDSFADVEDPLGSLTYVIQSNTNESLFSGVEVSMNSWLKLAYRPDASGSADITILAKDTHSATVTATLNVTVNPVADSGPAAVASAAYATREEGTPATLLVTRTGETDKTLTAGYRVLPIGTAESEDVTPLMGVITFLPGQTEATVTLTALPDALFEPAETAVVEVYDINGEAQFGPQTTTSVTIAADNRPPTAQNQDGLTQPGSGFGFASLGVDPDGDPLTLSFVSPPTSWEAIVTAGPIPGAPGRWWNTVRCPASTRQATALPTG